MNAVGLSLMASGCTATSSFFFRRNADVSPGKSASPYLVFFFLLSLLSSLIFSPAIWSTPVNYVILAVGASVGLLSSTLMMLTSSALKRGPAALTFAFQNASAIFPGVILFFLVGSDFGYSCSPVQLLGMLIVLGGLLFGAMKEARKLPQTSRQWLFYAFACFLVQIIALTLIQARCLLFGCTETGGSFFSDFTISQAEDVWFMPGQFAAGLAVQLINLFRSRTRVRKNEVIYGSIGGVANFSSTLFLLLATKFAAPYEQAIVFPIFAVASMVLCNIWANRLYQEPFNYGTNALCAFGIFLSISK